jgi:RNA polymerase sigma-70 factor, ECF subfamily
MPPEVPLASAFVAAFRSAFGGDHPDLPDPGSTPSRALERQLTTLIQRARAGWPELDLDEAAFVTHVARVLIPDAAAGASIAEQLEAVHASDLWLAFGCAEGHEDAVNAFDKEVLRDVGPMIARLQPTPQLVDEIRQQLREKLLLAAPGKRKEARIAEYAGRAPLSAWVRVAATRAALDVLRAAGARRESDVEPDDLSPGGDSPELEYLKERYRPQFKAAFQTALGNLDAEQRTVLRMHVVEGLNIDEIGGLFRVHRSTIARWIAEARVAILDGARRSLQQKLGLNEAEFHSLAGVVRSQLSLSLTDVLGKRQ